VRVLVTASSPEGTTQAASNASTVIGTPTNTAAPGLSGTARHGQALSATAGSWNDLPTQFAYAWQRCAADGGSCTSNGYTGSTYTLRDTDVGYRLRARVSATNAAGTTQAYSASSDVVQVRAPVNTAVPDVSVYGGGGFVTGQAALAGDGGWSPAPTTLARRWQRCDATGAGCVDVPGQTAAYYRLGDSDVGQRIRLVVDASNSTGTTTAVSAASPVVAAAPATGGDAGLAAVGPGTTTTVLPAAVARVTRVAVTGSRATLRVVCSSASDCAGRLTLSYKGRRLAVAKFDVAGESAATVKVRLARSAVRRLPRRGRIKVAVRLQIDGAAANTRTLTTRRT
jgi:hypothetical protein